MGRSRKAKTNVAWPADAMAKTATKNYGRIEITHEHGMRQCRYCGYQAGRFGCLCDDYQEDVRNAVTTTSIGRDIERADKTIKVKESIAVTRIVKNVRFEDVQASDTDDSEITDVEINWDIVSDDMSEVDSDWSVDSHSDDGSEGFGEWEDVKEDADLNGSFSGYIGGTVLSQLLSLPGALSRFEFRAVVRDLEKAKKLSDEFGVKTIVGSQSDQELISKEASEVDVVLGMADNDDGAVEGILKGIKKRFEATGKPPTFIHTSGTGALADPSDKSGNVLWNDEDVARMEKITFDAVPRSRSTFLRVVAADEEGSLSIFNLRFGSASVNARTGYVRTYVAAPSLVYGVASHPISQAGISKSRAPLYKYLASTAITRGAGLLLGSEKTVWPIVDVGELADFYIILFNAALDKSIGKNLSHGRRGHFLLGADELKCIDLHSAISKSLFSNGKVRSPEPVPFTREDALKTFGPYGGTLHDMLAHDVRVESNRARGLGWKPRKSTSDLLGSVPEEVEFVVKSL
ncbi:hypothetical protein V5O48_010987 [Marasmius crinis-equi]|uniref:Cadherin domain-containing protein n=1 Tax=Marasmius crinis-equi TaxID=585013 RepID=A0ABR3F6T7_9AGAR